MAEASPSTAKPAEAPWHAAFPAPRIDARSVSREEVLQWLREGKTDFVLVDVRRMDCEGGLIRGSINLPAQSLYYTIPALYNLFSAAKKTKVIWYCGSSSGRGPRCAGWFADYLNEFDGRFIESLNLGGIKGWARGGEEFVKLMDGYEASAWQ